MDRQFDGANQIWSLRTKNQIPIHEHIQVPIFYQTEPHQKFSLPKIIPLKLDHKEKETTKSEQAHLPHIKNLTFFYLPPALPSPLSSTSASNK